MSQAKVDKYKESKANRKEIIKKEKQRHKLEKIGISVVAVLVVGWLGFSVYVSYLDSIPKETVSINYTAIDDYLTSISE